MGWADRAQDEIEVLLRGLLVGVVEGLPDIVHRFLEAVFVALCPFVDEIAVLVEALVDRVVVISLPPCSLDSLSSPALDRCHQACHCNVAHAVL